MIILINTENRYTGMFTYLAYPTSERLRKESIAEMYENKKMSTPEIVRINSQENIV